MGGPLEFSSWGCPEVLGLAPHSVWGGGGAESQCLSHSDSGSTRNSGQGVGWSWWLGQQEIECSRRVWQPILANMLQYSCLENPLSDKEAWQATVHRIAKSWTQPKWPCTHRGKIFFACGSSAPVRRCSCLACGNPGDTKCAGTQTASATGVMAFLESFFQLLVAGGQKACSASLSP